MNHKWLRRGLIGGALAIVAGAAIACSGGASQADLTAAQNELKDKETQLAAAQSQLTAAQGELTAAKGQISTKQTELAAVQKQLAGIGPSTVVQVGQLQPAAAGAQPSGWDTAESIRGGLRLEATYDSSGPNAWDPVAHPLVFYTSEGMGYGHRPSKTNKLPGVQIIDATTKEVVASALFDLGEEVTTQPHGAGVSPDGKWFYVGFGERVKATKESKNLILVVNARTLKLDRVLSHPTQRLHHIMGFTDWQGRPRVALEMGFGSNGGPHFIVDPKDDNRVVKAITIEDTGYKMGHPYLSVDPTGKFLYVQLENAAWREVSHEIGGLAKMNLEKNTVTVIPGTGDHPIGVVHTAD
ncbi:MAG: hypothetical protein HY678_00500, partial [Chloroflexi bacterium]|nr:hypothetical protein [Chloroflexota bacterium]